MLIIEDNQADQNLIIHALRKADSAVIVHAEANGLDAVLYIKGEVKFADRNAYPFPDVIVLDLQMPLFDGFEFLEWLRTKGPPSKRNTPVIVVTGNTRPEDVSRAYQVGASSVIEKPMDSEGFNLVARTIAHYWQSNTNTKS